MANLANLESFAVSMLELAYMTFHFVFLGFDFDPADLRSSIGGYGILGLSLCLR